MRFFLWHKCAIALTIAALFCDTLSPNHLAHEVPQAIAHLLPQRGTAPAPVVLEEPKPESNAVLVNWQ